MPAHLAAVDLLDGDLDAAVRARRAARAVRARDAAPVEFDVDVDVLPGGEAAPMAVLPQYQSHRIRGRAAPRDDARQRALPRPGARHARGPEIEHGCIDGKHAAVYRRRYDCLYNCICTRSLRMAA